MQIFEQRNFNPKDHTVLILNIVRGLHEILDLFIFVCVCFATMSGLPTLVGGGGVRRTHPSHPSCLRA